MYKYARAYTHTHTHNTHAHAPFYGVIRERRHYLIKCMHAQ